MSLAASKDSYKMRQEKAYWTYSLKQRKIKWVNIALIIEKIAKR